ncbi:MAG: signal peptidase II [Chitinophagaceae bacterium]
MRSVQLVRVTLILMIIIINIGCDQVTKTIVREKVEPYSTISLLNDHVTITKVENTGAFLSAGNSLTGAKKYFLLSVLPLTALTLGFIYILFKQSLSPVMIGGLCFIIGGGLGNIFDRIAYGSVTDFLHIRVASLQTGIFNMADVSIMTGAAVLLLHSVFKKRN